MTIEFYAKPKAADNTWVRPGLEVMQFPGGEWHIKNNDKTEYTNHAAIVRGADVNDLVIAALWADLLPDNLEAHLFLPYIPAARADRGLPFGARIYAQFVEAIAATSITYIDPHSTVAPHFDPYRRLGREINLPSVVKRAVSDRYGMSPYYAVIAPDKGAHARAEAVGNKLEIPTWYASKQRDPDTGKLSNFQPPEGWADQDHSNRRYLVVDDICDGGGTFKGLQGSLGLPIEQLDLWVTHGIFSGHAISNLASTFLNVFTTDSHPGYLNYPEAKVTKLSSYFFQGIARG